jgi:formylglycine-generating enzyme required for sulfatase activity
MLPRARAIAFRYLLIAVAAALTSQMPAVAAPGDAFIIVGNKTYRSGIAPVEAADRDADLMQKVAREVFGLDDRHGIHRFDNMTIGQAARWFGVDGTPGAALLQFIRQASQGRRDATVYFYYSGHGAAARNARRSVDELHLILDDTSVSHVGEEGLSIEAVRQALVAAQKEVVPAGRVVMMIDACFSGFGRDGEEVWKGARAGAFAAKLAAPDNVAILSAAGPNEPAWSDANRKYGAFTDALVDGLYGDAADEHGRITAASLQSFVQRRVAARLTQQPRGPRYQTPMLAGDGRMVVASLRQPFPEREPGRAARFKRRCVVELASDKVESLSAFLAGECGIDCPCRAEVEAKLAAQQRHKRLCDEEGEEADKLIARLVDQPGIFREPSTDALSVAQAREAFAAMGRVSGCPAVKARIDRMIADLQRVEEKRKSEAEARAREAERKLAEAVPVPAAPPAARPPPASRTPATTAPEPPGPASTSVPIPDPARQYKPGSGRSFQDCAGCPWMVVVPQGSFVMGSPPNEKGRDEAEGPQHRVVIAQPFAIGQFEVTFDEWDSCVANGGCLGHRPDDAGWGRGRRPVIKIDWTQARSYAAWLSRTTGWAYRLPSEAEWEYAARAGTTTKYAFGDTITSKQARFSAQSTATVGSFPANAWGLHDMHGNVWEWVEDCWNDRYTGAPSDGAIWREGDCGRNVRRGGSWIEHPRFIRSAFRYSGEPENGSIVGFRVVRSIGVLATKNETEDPPIWRNLYKHPPK